MQPPNEARRLDALRRYRALDTLPDQALDDLTALAAQICEAPISTITLMDEGRQWVKSKFGVTDCKASRDNSFCAHAILQAESLIIPDATQDERFVDNPLVTGDLHIRFYAGVPLITPDGEAIGTLCVFDRVPRQLTSAQIKALQVLSRQVMAQLELRRQSRILTENEDSLFNVLRSCPVGVTVHSASNGAFVEANAAFSAIFGYSREEVLGRTVDDLRIVDPKELKLLRSLSKTRAPLEYSEVPVKTRTGELRHVLLGVAHVELRGEPHAIITFVDITSRKKAESESLLLNQRVSLATEAAAIGIWDWNIATDQWYATDQYSTMLGYDPSVDSTDRDFWFQRIHPDDLDPVREKIRAVLAGQAAHYEYEARIRHADGEYRWIHVVGRVLASDANGKPTRLLGVRMDITDRHHIEQGRRSLEARYRTLFEYAPDGILIADPDSTYVDANTSICAMLGYTRDELIGRHASDIVIETEIPNIVSALNVIHARQEYQREWQLRRKDGSTFAAEVMATMMPDGNLMGVIRDVTERKRAESRIGHLNRVYAVLSDTNESIVREKNPQAMFEGACRVAVEKGQFRLAWIGLVDATSDRIRITAHAGASDDTLRTLDSLLDDERSGGGCAFTAQAFRTGEHGVCNNIAGDARTVTWRAAALERDYRAMASLPLKTGGRVVGTFNLYSSEPGFFDADELRLLDALALDISFALDVNESEQERLRAEFALRESDERFRQLAENIKEVFWITDVAKSKFMYISPAYETIWGRTVESLYAAPNSWLEGVHPDDRARIQLASETKQAPGTFNETYRIVRPDGSLRWIHDRAFPVHGDHGEIRRIVGTAEDITERLHLEEQFRQSHKMEAIGQLAGGVAHDFNNILAAIMMQADLATVTNPPEETRELLHDIKAATERAASLTRQLLAFSRRQVLQPCQLDLNDIVTSLTKMLQRILGEDVRLQLNLASHPLLTRADAGMLDQILLNLIVNSRDAMPEGGQLTIETTDRILTAEDAATIPDASAGHYICLRVTDTGSGIAPQQLPRIFEPFYTTKETGKGTGLGLATVFGIVKQHGGSVTVDSALGKGTTFQVFLRADDAVALPSAADPSTAPKGGTETILLVEDEAAVRRVTRIVLERHGYQVLEAANGVEALTLWEQHHDAIRLLFTDMVMPEGISGRELAGLLRERDPKLRVIFTSGYSADIAGRELSLREGQNFISKPSNTHELLATVRRSLDA